MILIDNYDSFTYNIVQYLEELGTSPKVFKNNEITIPDLKKLKFESIILSPGPGNPNTAGITLDVIKEFYKTKKILGICLGHQSIAQFFGGEIIKDKNPYHGKISKIEITQNSQLFSSLPNEFNVTRYHSLMVNPNTVPNELKVTSTTKDGIIMSIEHKTHKIFGVQFHPEAILTEYGHEILENFINM